MKSFKITDITTGEIKTGYYKDEVDKEIEIQHNLIQQLLSEKELLRREVLSLKDEKKHAWSLIKGHRRS